MLCAEKPRSNESIRGSSGEVCLGPMATSERLLALYRSLIASGQHFWGRKAGRSQMSAQLKNTATSKTGVLPVFQTDAPDAWKAQAFQPAGNGTIPSHQKGSCVTGEIFWWKVSSCQLTLSSVDVGRNCSPGIKCVRSESFGFVKGVELKWPEHDNDPLSHEDSSSYRHLLSWCPFKLSALYFIKTSRRYARCNLGLCRLELAAAGWGSDGWGT
eukprot:1154577-Pelagomonas_calceolata.AAC.3